MQCFCGQNNRVKTTKIVRRLTYNIVIEVEAGNEK